MHCQWKEAEQQKSSKKLCLAKNGLSAARQIIERCQSYTKWQPHTADHLHLRPAADFIYMLIITGQSKSKASKSTKFEQESNQNFPLSHCLVFQSRCNHSAIVNIQLCFSVCSFIRSQFFCFILSLFFFFFTKSLSLPVLLNAIAARQRFD